MRRIEKSLARISLAVGLLFLAFVLGVVLHGCGSDSGPTGPDQNTPPPVAPAAPTPTPPPPDAGGLPTPTEDPALYVGGFKGCTLYIDVAKNAKDKDFDITVFKVIGPKWDNQIPTDFHATVHATKPYSEFDLCYIPERFQCWIEVHVGNLLVAHHFNKGKVCTQDQCVETWQEQEPQITYGEWGECGAVGPSSVGKSQVSECQHSRTKTTVVNEVNSCTQEVREKSRTQETVTEPCECSCVEQWIALDPVVTEGEWGECTAGGVGQLCSQTRTITTVWSEQNSCTQEVREVRRKTQDESQQCDCPGFCYYRVSCGGQSTFGGVLTGGTPDPGTPHGTGGTTNKGGSCTDQQQQAICEAAVGVGGDGGIWLNFVEGALHNHCKFNPPGYQNNDFQLAPGQSAPNCLNKND